MKLTYQTETFSKARRCLMLPHSQGEAESIEHAFSECKTGLLDLNEQDLDGHAKNCLEKLRKLMAVTDIASLTIEQKAQLSSMVDELADWFKSQLYSAP